MSRKNCAPVKIVARHLDSTHPIEVIASGHSTPRAESSIGERWLVAVVMQTRRRGGAGGQDQRRRAPLREVVTSSDRPLAGADRRPASCRPPRCPRPAAGAYLA